MSEQTKPIIEEVGTYTVGMVVISNELLRRIEAGEVTPPITQTKDMKVEER